MGTVARWIGPMLVTSFGAQSWSCLLDRPIVQEGQYVTPLAPPVIVEQRMAGASVVTNPLPGEILVAPTPDGSTPFTVSFTVTIRYDFPVRLTARLWKDRDLEDCSTGEPRTCGQELRLQPVAAPDAGIDRRVRFNMDFLTPNKCTRVDLFVSPRFRDDDDTVRHLPERPGEAAHARWYVIVPNTNGQRPPVEACQDARRATQG
jgi:hypothetical protein